MRGKKTVIFIIAVMVMLLTGCLPQKESQNADGGKNAVRGFTSVYPTMNVRGTNNSWGTLAMTLTNNNEWTITNVKFGTTSTERFKFDVYGNWATNFGLNGVQAGADIPVTAGKTYDIKFNDATKSYTLTESIITKCDVAVILNDVTTNPAVNLTGVVAKLTGAGTADVTLMATSGAITGLSAGNYILTMNATVKAGTDDYKVTGTKTFVVSATDKNISVILDVTKEKIVKGSANISIVVTGAAITDFMTLYNSDNTLVKVYKDGTTITAEKVINSIGYMTVSNIIEGSYRVAVDYNISGKKYAGETTFAITKTATMYTGIMNVTYTENKIFLKTYPTMSFRGTPNGWAATPMTLTADYTWSISGVKTGTTATERFKFDVNGDWTTNFGLNGGTADIPLDANSTYNIAFNDANKNYTLTKITVPTLTVPVTSATIKTGTAYTLPTTGTYTTNGIGSQVNLTWTPAVDTSKTGVTVYTGTANGLAVTFTLTVSDSFISTYQNMYFRGTPNSWTTTKMNLIADYTWQTQADFAGVITGTEPDRFKFDGKGDWTISFGDNEPDFIADLIPSAKDVFVKNGAGKYVITFNDMTRAYSVTKITLPTLTVTTTTATVKKGNTAFVLPTTGTYTKDGAASQVSLAWTPALDINKIGDTVYSATANGLTVTFTLTVLDNIFASTYANMYFRGTPNNWTTTRMNLIADYTWQIEGDFAGVTSGTNPDRFKFDGKGDWSVSFGDNEPDGIADLIPSAKDIYVTGGVGRYAITFDDSNRKYTVAKKVSVTGVTISTATAVMIVGENTTLAANIMPSNATNKNIVWASSNATVADVVDGKVTAKCEGVADITVTTADGGKTSICRVAVKKYVAVESVTLDTTTASMVIGDSVDLPIATVLPENASYKTVTWTTSNSAVARIENGKIVGVTEGSTDITVTTDDIKKTAIFKVVVGKLRPTLKVAYSVIKYEIYDTQISFSFKASNMEKIVGGEIKYAFRKDEFSGYMIGNSYLYKNQDQKWHYEGDQTIFTIVFLSDDNIECNYGKGKYIWYLSASTPNKTGKASMNILSCKFITSTGEVIKDIDFEPVVEVNY